MTIAETLPDLIARWDSGEGKPYKGKLIDYAEFTRDPTNISCMCAEGQVLHVLGGWSPEKLRDTKQPEADKETAKLLNISVGHAILLSSINDSVDGAPSIVLTAPEKVLGDQARIVLALWLHLDRMTEKDWAVAVDGVWAVAGDVTWAAARADAAASARYIAGAGAWVVARSVAWAAARAAAWAAAWDAANAAAKAAAWAAAWAAEYACSEIQGAALMRERGKPFFFLPLLGFADPESIPALPADYGVPA